jgi:hypothetical protein
MVALNHAPHLCCSSVCDSGWISEDEGAVGRALTAIALLSQIKPPRSHPTPNKTLIEITATDYSP